MAENKKPEDQFDMGTERAFDAKRLTQSETGAFYEVPTKREVSSGEGLEPTFNIHIVGDEVLRRASRSRARRASFPSRQWRRVFRQSSGQLLIRSLMASGVVH